MHKYLKSDTGQASTLTRQLQRLVTEERPGACVGCGYENSCSTRGCAVLRKISGIVARGGDVDGKTEH